jgi:radical SAM protein with 4Fe4S-binding SPASM domain
VILQARDLGARKVIVLSGGKAIDARTLEMVQFIRSRDLEAELFTKGSGITGDYAKQLFQEQARVVLEIRTIDENIQNLLIGEQHSSNPIQRAYKNLKGAGYPSEKALLAVNTTICSHNIDELVRMWQWLREQNIVPYFRIIAPQDSAQEDERLGADPRRLREIFTQIAEIDRTQYGQVWNPQPPLLGNRCMRHQFSCLVRSQGDILPCVGLHIRIGNIRDHKLSDIIRDSEVLQDLKDHIHTIKGPCSNCEKAGYCYGCRGAAYHLTGDYLASDPLCWNNAERADEIARLPFAVAEIIPQKSPMRVVDTLVQVGERSGKVSVTVSPEMPFIKDDGVLDEAAYFEMMAQSIAALNSFKGLGTSECSSEGYLVGAQALEILGTARVGDTLSVSVFKDARFGKFAVVKARVSRGSTVLARGEIKIWHDAVRRGQETLGSEGGRGKG